MIKSAKYVNISLRVEYHNNTALTKHRKTFHKLAHINECNFLENAYFINDSKNNSNMLSFCYLQFFLNIDFQKGNYRELSLATKIFKVVLDFLNLPKNYDIWNKIQKMLSIKPFCPAILQTSALQIKYFNFGKQLKKYSIVFKNSLYPEYILFIVVYILD